MAALIFLLAATGRTLVWLDESVRPVVLSNAQYECERCANAAFRAALAQQEEGMYEQLYELLRGTDGHIRGVLFNTGRITRLEAALAAQMQKELARYTTDQTMSLPLAVLLGGQVWAGPRLTLRLLPDAFVSVEIYDTLEAAGINQTRLCLRARFTAQMSVILAGYGMNTDVQQEVLLAEILLAGDVPQGYLGDGNF